MRNDDFFKKFDRDFANTHRTVRRGFAAVITIAVLWLCFAVGAASTVVFLLGRWIGAW
jgi:hypothetical protein